MLLITRYQPSPKAIIMAIATVQANAGKLTATEIPGTTSVRFIAR
jgi:hypothetical protein